MRSNILVLIVLLVAALVLSGCTPGGGHFSDNAPAGFFWGIWHGWIAPVSLLIGLFDDTTRIYEPNNTGWFYDLGFYLAVVGGFGGLSLSRKKFAHRARSRVYVETRSA
jgi:hypothetical protein